MPPSKALVVVNPAANHGETARLVPVVDELLSACFPHDIVLTDSPSQAVSIVENAQGYDTVIAMGGDGTAHEVLNGIMARPERQRPALSLLPTGSGNDYGRTLGISTELSVAVQQIASGVRRRVDVGTCNDTFYANSLAIGLDAKVTFRAAELKVTTGRTGLTLYLSALLHVLAKEFEAWDVMLRFDDEEPREIGITLIALTHGPTYGGGFHITPDSEPDDGLIDVCLVDRLPRWDTAWRLPFVIPGKHTWMAPVHMSRHRRCRIEAQRPIPGQIDGEVMMSSVYDVGVLPGALEVIAPEGPS